MIRGLIDRFFIKKPLLREAVTRLLERDQDLFVNLFGTQLCVNAIREHGYLRAFRKSQSSSLFRDDLTVLLNLALLLEDGDTFVDVGANVGVFVCTLARASLIDNRTCKFYAYEANPDTYARLLRSVGTLPIHAEQLAISNKHGDAQFIAGAVSHVFTSLEHANSYNIKGRYTTVQTRCLDDLGVSGDSLVIKIDVEGQEREVLEGAARLFETGRVKAVYVDGYKDPAVRELIESYGMKLHNGHTLLPAERNVFGLLGVRRSARA